MAQLALRAFAYGVDKIPDSAWDRVPGGYFRDKERQRKKQEEKRRVDRRSRSDSRGPRRSGSRSRHHHDDDYYSDTGENAHSYGKHREGYSVPRDAHGLDRNKNPSPPPTDPSPGVPQHESGHYPEPPGHPHGQQHYQSHTKNQNPGINPNQYYFPPPPTQAFEESNPPPQAQPQNFEQPQMGHGAEYYSRPGQPTNPAATGYASGTGPSTQYATQYPSAQPTPNPYAPHSGSPAGAAAAGAFSPPPPSSSSSASQRYRPQHSLNGAATAGPYDRVYTNDNPNQPAAPTPGTATREPYIPYSNAMYYSQPAQQAAAYRNSSISRGSPRGSIGSGSGGSRPNSRGARDSPYSFREYAADHPRDGRDAHLTIPTSRGRDPQRRPHSASDEPRRSKSRLAGLSERLGTDEKGLGAGALGALAGGLIGHEVGRGGFSTLAGILIGGVGAHALEQRHEKKKKKGGRRRAEEGEQIYREDGYEKRDGYYSDG